VVISSDTDFLFFGSPFIPLDMLNFSDANALTAYYVPANRASEVSRTGEVPMKFEVDQRQVTVKLLCQAVS
jgi:hypothetical protein